MTEGLKRFLFNILMLASLAWYIVWLFTEVQKNAPL